MPEKWCRELRNAALNCSQNTVLQLIEEIPQQYNSLQNQLNNLANNFQFDTIANISEQAMGREE